MVAPPPMLRGNVQSQKSKILAIEWRTYLLRAGRNAAPSVKEACASQELGGITSRVKVLLKLTLARLQTPPITFTDNLNTARRLTLFKPNAKAGLPTFEWSVII